MDWVNEHLKQDSKHVLGLLCSQISSDIASYNLLPSRLRWNAVEVQEFILLPDGPERQYARVFRKKQGSSDGLGDCVIQLTAMKDDSAVNVIYRGYSFPSMYINMDKGWHIKSESGDLNSREIWEVSEQILNPIFFPL